MLMLMLITTSRACFGLGRQAAFLGDDGGQDRDDDDEETDDVSSELLPLPEDGFASSVISTPSIGAQAEVAASMIAATVSGGISDGVPPPKKIDPSRRPGSKAASCARSQSSAARHVS